MTSYLKLFAIVTAFSLLPLGVTSQAADDIRTWTEKARQELSSKQRYPRRAIDANVEGTTVVDIKVNHAGSIVAFSIKESSGSPILDGEVLGLLARVNPFPALPDGIDSTSLTVPLAYRLDRNVKVDAQLKVADTAATMQDWAKNVSRILARNQSYPTSLLESGVEGVVTVELVIASSGDITAQRVLKSSGNEVLDMDALNLFWQITPLPALPEGKDNFKVKIPLNYRISNRKRTR